MPIVTTIEDYADHYGNSIQSQTVFASNVRVEFRGRDNRVIVAKGARITRLQVFFDCDNGTLIIGENPDVGGIQMSVRIGQDSMVSVGNNVSTTGMTIISAVEGAQVVFGNDVMIASDNHFRADDGHPIFDIDTKLRVNKSRDIYIGDHVWFAAGACALGGAVVGEGSVVGFRSLVTGTIPNNTIAVGSPARVVRSNIAWERPHLSLAAPYYKSHASTIALSSYWKRTVLTTDDTDDLLSTPPRTLIQKVMHRFGYVKSG